MRAGTSRGDFLRGSLAVAIAAILAFPLPAVTVGPPDPVPQDDDEAAGGADPLAGDVDELPAETSCANAIDDEQDGLVDCEDPDCELLACDDQSASTANDTCRSGSCIGDAIEP